MISLSNTHSKIFRSIFVPHDLWLLVLRRSGWGRRVVEVFAYLDMQFSGWGWNGLGVRITPQLSCECWKTNLCCKSWHYTFTRLKLTCEGLTEIVNRVWLDSDKALAISKRTNIQINIVLSLWQLRIASWQCPNIAISICMPWIITQNAGILGRPKLFYYF